MKNKTTKLVPFSNPRTFAAFAHDVAAAMLAWLLAYWLRFNFDVPVDYAQAARVALIWLVPLFAGLFYLFGLYRGLWRFASISDLHHLIAAIGVGALLTTAVVAFFTVPHIPRSVLVLHPMLLAVIMGGSRFAYRSWKEHRLYGPAKLRGQPVLVIGSGESADSLLREIGRSGQWYAVAVLEDSPGRSGRQLRGLPIVSRIDQI